MPLLYDLGIRAYRAGLALAALRNPKARAWIEGRRSWAADLERALAGLPAPTGGRLWIHCASVGEFEQGRPLIEALKARHPQLQVVLSFFSPSGYELRRNYPLADHVAYLPLDTRRNARNWLDRIQPTLVVFVKYEFWYHLLRETQSRKIPVFLISGRFRRGQLFFRPGGGTFRRLLRGFDHLFVQDADSADLLSSLAIGQHSVVGDTRVDRVTTLARQSPHDPIAAAFAADAEVLVAGSTWPPDAALLADLRRGAWAAPRKLILAPHEIHTGHLETLEARLPGRSIRYSHARTATVAAYDNLLIDNVGRLAALYRYGRLAYVGGGFGAGIHNILEPIAYAMPVLFGPRYGKFLEARRLTADGAAFAVANARQLEAQVLALQNDAAYQRAVRAAKAYIEANQGATEAIVEHLDRQGLP